jgi:hypothetical protein
MKQIIQSLVKSLNLSAGESIVYGDVDGILYYVRFYRTPLRDMYPSLIARLLAPKCEEVDIKAFVSRKDGADLRHIGTRLSDNYPIYRAEKARYRNGEMSVYLQKNGSVNIKASYIGAFLHFLSDYLHENGYYTACTQCGQSEGVSYHPDAHTAVCAQCLINRAKL